MAKARCAGGTAAAIAWAAVWLTAEARRWSSGSCGAIWNDDESEKAKACRYCWAAESSVLLEMFEERRSDVAAAADMVISIITEDHGVRKIFTGPDGFLSTDVTGKLFIEMSTVAPKVETDLAPKVRGKGAALVECPVGGSTAPARKGQLLGLMGAEPADAAMIRDYYRVEDEEGRRFWLFRAGPAGNPPTRWYIHGIFS